MSNMRGKTVFITGGSSGIGKEIGRQLAARGAHVTIFARRQELLDSARTDILAARLDDSQEVNAVSLDATDANQVVTAFRSQPRLPDILYCNAGFAAPHIGHFTDLSPTDFDKCMKGNYYTAVYCAHAMMNMWLEDDQKAHRSSSTSCKLRQIVFINSCAALFPVPGYVAYTTAKCAVRGLADTLRMECLRYSGPSSKYTIHCAFPSSVLTPSFIAEQSIKPEVTKKIEGSTGPIDQLHTKVPSTETVVRQIITRVEQGDFAIAEDSFDSNFFYATNLGVSPKRGWGVWDTTVGILSNVLWPVYRLYFDSLVREENIWKKKRD